MNLTKMLTPLIVLTALSAAQSQPMLTNNIVINNWNFEDGTVPNQTVTSWTETGGAATQYQVITNEPVAEGIAYCYFRGLNSAQDNGGINQTTSSTWKPGTYTIELAAASLLSSGNGFNVKLYANAKNNNLMNEVLTLPPPLGTTNWQTHQFSVVIAADNSELGKTVGVHFSPKTTQAGTVNFVSALDKVVLTHVGSVGIYGYGNALAANPNRPTPTNQIGLGTSVSFTPLFQGTPTAYAISPALPPASGLSFDTFSGTISGSALEALPLTGYEITANFSEGWTNSTTIALEIVSPALVGYTPASATVVVNTGSVSMTPVLVGELTAVPTNYFVTPSLPTGITLDSFSGAISGTPSVTGSNTYSVIAQYESYGMSTAAVTIVVSPPSLVRYADNDFKVAVGSGIRLPGLPTLSGVDVPTSYSVLPALPAGFNLDPVTGALSGTGMVTSATSTHTITATYSGYPNSSVNVAIEVLDGFADDFNFGTGALDGDATWTTQIPGGFSLNGRVANSPGGNSGFTGPTSTYNVITNEPGQDFTLSTKIIFGAGHRAGLVFGFQDINNFWMCMVNNGAETTSGLNTDFRLSYIKDQTNQIVVMQNGSQPNIILGETYTLTVRYDDDIQTLGFEILDSTNGVYYATTYQLQPGDLPVASNTLFGIQSWTASNVGFNNFLGNFEEVDLSVPVNAPVITAIQHNPATGQSIVTWTSDDSSTYDLIGGSEANSTGVLESAIPGQPGSTSATNTQPVSTAKWFYRVKRN